MAGLFCEISGYGSEVKRILLLVDEKSLKERLTNDIEKGVRLVDVAVRSIVRIPLYQVLNKYDKSLI